MNNIEYSSITSHKVQVCCSVCHIGRFFLKKKILTCNFDDFLQFSIQNDTGFLRITGVCILCIFLLTLKLIHHGPTDRPTDIVLYRAAIVAKNIYKYWVFSAPGAHKRKKQQCQIELGGTVRCSERLRSLQ